MSGEKARAKLKTIHERGSRSLRNTYSISQISKLSDGEAIKSLAIVESNRKLGLKLSKNK